MEVTRWLFGMHMLFVVEGPWAPNMHLSKPDMANVAVLFGILIFSQSHWKAFILQYFFRADIYGTCVPMQPVAIEFFPGVNMDQRWFQQLESKSPGGLGDFSIQFC